MEQDKAALLHGLTGEIGRDGLLTPEQSILLNQMQAETAEATMAYLDARSPEGKFPLVAMATGFGKGKIIHELVRKELERNAQAKILVIAGTKVELSKQTAKALTGYQQGTQSGTIFAQEDDGEEYVEAEEQEDISNELETIEEAIEEEAMEGYTVGRYGEKDATVEVTTVQRVQSEHRRGVLDHSAYDLVIVDEVHNIGTKKRYEAIKGFNRVAGFTATPFRHSGEMKEPEDYGFEIIRSLPLPEAQELRFLPPLFALQINTAEIAEEIPMTRNGKIDYGKLEKQLKKNEKLRPYIADKIAPLLTLNGNNYKTVIAVNYVWEAQEMAELLRAKGIKVGLAVNKNAAKKIHSEEIPALDAIERYKLPHGDENGIQVLISPYVAGEGFDAPFTEMLVWASPTDSPLRYTQYTGRLARRAPGKAYGVVIDCLYQTSQYNWSYNFGMWMKGHVRQLEDGRMYMGPIQDIKDMTAIEEMRRMTENHQLEELQKEGILRIQDTDIPLTHDGIELFFHGDGERLLRIAREETNDLTTLVQRRSGGHVVTVVTEHDTELFVERMKKRGILVHQGNIELLHEDEFSLSPSNIIDIFGSTNTEILNIVGEVVKQIEEEGLGSIVLRRRGTRIIRAVTNIDYFFELMFSKGAKLKAEFYELQDNDIAIIGDSLTDIFIGSPDTLRPLALETAAELSEDNPTLIATVKLNLASRRPVVVVKDKELFKQRMRSKNVFLKEDIVPYEPGTMMSVSPPNLRELFKGNAQKLMDIADIVIEIMRKQDAGSVVMIQLKNRKIIPAITNLEVFIELMKQQGVKLKHN